MSHASDLRALFVAAAAILVSCPASSPAWGQGVGGGRQPTGSGLTSGVGFGNAGFGSNAGSGGLGGGGLGAGGGIGQGGFGQGGLGQGGMGQGGLGASGFGGQGGFGQTQSGFIGRDSSEVTAMFDNMARQGQQFMNRAERAMNRGGRQATDTGEQTQQQVRIKLRVGFDFPDPATSPMSAEFDSRMSRLMTDRDVSDLSFQRQGGTVVVSGTAADEFERMLVEQILAQQPGVATVTNQMTVAEAIDAPTPQE